MPAFVEAVSRLAAATCSCTTPVRCSQNRCAVGVDLVLLTGLPGPEDGVQSHGGAVVAVAASTGNQKIIFLHAAAPPRGEAN